MPTRIILQQLHIFILLGLLTFILDYGLMWLALILNAHYLAAATIGFIVSLGFNYWSNARFTFQTSLSSCNLVKFGTLALMNYSLTLAFVAGAQFEFNDALFGKAISIPLVACNSFLWSRYWVFNSRR